MDCIGKLKSLREGVNFKSERERGHLVRQLYELIGDWEGQLSNLRDIFDPEEIDLLILETLTTTYYDLEAGIPWENILVDFVIESGYKDEPVGDENCKISLRRTTPVHHAKYCTNGATSELLKIYGNHFVNYADESGYTYFHAAAKSGHAKLVEKFLELGQDPDCVWRETGESPLHLALAHHDVTVVKLLLRGGACPNLADDNGITPLHRVCTPEVYRCSAEAFLETNDELWQRVRIDAKDKAGRTPLQVAVLFDHEKTVKLLDGLLCTTFAREKTMMT